MVWQLHVLYIDFFSFNKPTAIIEYLHSLYFSGFEVLICHVSIFPYHFVLLQSMVCGDRGWVGQCVQYHVGEVQHLEPGSVTTLPRGPVDLTARAPTHSSTTATTNRVQVHYTFESQRTITFNDASLL